jgi:3-oxoacyl-[acyl-carrier-protein] synthase II
MSIMAAAHAMQIGSFPNTAGTRDVDPAAEFDVVTAQPVTVEVDVVQVNAFGFGGQDTSVVIRRPAEPS